MAQQNDWHLTIEQLSAWLDKQLSPEEEAVFSAHVRTCGQCQGVLADLRQTVSLLHALPQAAVPRSFVLPAGIAPIQERPVSMPAATTSNITSFPATRTRSKSAYFIQRSLRAMSTIAAVLGLIFILSSAITSLPHFGAGGAGSTTSSNSQVPRASGESTDTGVSNPANRIPTSTRQPQNTGLGTPIATPKSTSAATPTAAPTNSAQGHGQTTNRGGPSSPLPPILDLSHPEGFTGIGSILLVLGILGIIFTRRRQQQAT